MRNHQRRRSGRGFELPATPSGALAVRSVVPADRALPLAIPPLSLGRIGRRPLPRAGRLGADASRVLLQRPQTDRTPPLVHPLSFLDGQWAEQTLLVPIRLGAVPLRPALEGADVV